MTTPTNQELWDKYGAFPAKGRILLFKGDMYIVGGMSPQMEFLQKMRAVLKPTMVTPFKCDLTPIAPDRTFGLNGTYDVETPQHDTRPEPVATPTEMAHLWELTKTKERRAKEEKKRSRQEWFRSGNTPHRNFK